MDKANQNQHAEIMFRLGEIGSDIKSIRASQESYNSRLTKSEVELGRMNNEMITAQNDIKTLNQRFEDRRVQRDKEREQFKQDLRDTKNFKRSLFADWGIHLLWFVICVIIFFLAHPSSATVLLRILAGN